MALYLLAQVLSHGGSTSGPDLVDIPNMEVEGKMQCVGGSTSSEASWLPHRIVGTYRIQLSLQATELSDVSADSICDSDVVDGHSDLDDEMETSNWE
ncbi:unnamed protein product [Urochloa humidicola]